MSGEKKIYFKVYMDKHNIDTHYVSTQKDALNALDSWMEYAEDYDVLPPVIEPIRMTAEEFNNLPEFKGF